MVAIGSIRTWQPGRGPVTTWTASPASRAAMAAAAPDALPPSSQQEQHLRTAYRVAASGQDAPRLILASWRVEGWCDIAAMTAAINTHVRRHDTYHSAFEVTADSITRRTIDDPERIEFIPTALGFLETDEIRAYAETSTPGTLEWDCFTFGVVQNPDHFVVYANIDHLHTDGSSALVIYRDITHTYHAHAEAPIEQQHSPLAPAAAYRDFTARQHMQLSAMSRESRPVKDWVDFARDTDGDWPTFPLGLGEAAAGAGGVVTVELLNAEQTAAFAAVCRAAGARFSGGVMACAALADHRLTGTDTFHTYSPSDTRAGETASVTAGWYASLFPVSVDVAADDFSATARSAQKSFDANRNLSAVPMRRALDLHPAEEIGVPLPCGPSMMLSLMDFHKTPDANASGLGIYIDNLSHGDVNMWVTRNPDQTIVTVSFPDTAHARHSVHLYLGVLRSVFTTAAEPGLRRGYAHSAQLAG